MTMTEGKVTYDIRLYNKIKKVYSIWICMSPPKNRENSVTRYYIEEENLVGSVKEEKRHYDLMAAIMICLGHADGQNYAGKVRCRLCVI